ncbi:metal-dependent hydrolase [Micromonospora sediminicola]|uniref:metal-dependent hydrolase n=1 Tax=Micromonospora sediminicola TaxID=946078 RepID=UPI0037BB0A13
MVADRCDFPPHAASGRGVSVLGRTHAVSAVAGWLGGCAVLTAAGWTPGMYPVVVGGVVAAGAALLPDIDHPESTISRTLGPVTGLLAAAVHAASRWVRWRTCRHCAARPPRGGHRAATHTALFALAVGALLALTGWLAGSAAGLAVVWATAGLAARAVLSRRQRGALGAAGIATAAACVAAGAPGGWWWIGLPVAWGILAHSLGDAATVSGAPLLWPLRVRGCRWAAVGTPRWVRFRTGAAGERVVWWLLVLSGLVTGGYLLAA